MPISGGAATAHAADGATHTLSGAALSLVGATALNTLGLITPSSNPGAAAAVLASAADGGVQLLRLGIGADPDTNNRITLVDGGQIGQVTGPLVEFDDTNNYLEITGCNVGIGTTGPESKLHVAGDLRLSSVAAGSRFMVIGADAETNTGTGKLVLQAGPGSVGYGGAINLFAHAHATKPGWVTAALSSSAGSGATEARFTVNDQGLAGGTDLFTVLRTGNVGIGTTGPARILSIGAANGQQNSIGVLTELTTIAAAASTTTAIQIPAGALVVGVSVRVTTVIPTATTFDVGVSGATTRYGTGLSVVAGTTNPGTVDAIRYYSAATAIVITPNLTPADNTGRVRVTIHFIEVTPPTS